MEFEWDENKNRSNQRKHGIDFDDAKQAFNDKKRLIANDNRKDYGEERYLTIGSLFNVIIVVVYTLRNQTIRIISARMASKTERDRYHNIKN